MQSKIDFTVRAEDVTDELILKRCRDLQDAIRLCRDCSPLDDKQIIDEIKNRTGKEFQKSHFSECMNGTRNFPPRKVQVLEDICENLIPTRYMALSRNQELRPKKEAWEIENERLKRENEEKDIVIRTLMEVKK